jgi:hypothetical protein
MNLEIFSVFDRKAKAFIPPFFLPNRNMALRVFTDSVNDPEHQFHAHPEDYSLFHLGDFDQESGLIDSFSSIDLVANAMNVVNSNPPVTSTEGTQPDGISEQAATVNE